MRIGLFSLGMLAGLAIGYFVATQSYTLRLNNDRDAQAVSSWITRDGCLPTDSEWVIFKCPRLHIP
jgi:hypothetical protein